MDAIISLSTKAGTIPRNAYLKTGGSIDRNVYFIEDGSVRIFIADHQEEQTIRLGYKNNLIVALDSFLTGKPSPFYIQAIKKSTIRVINKQQMDTFIAEDANKGLWVKILEDLIVQQMEREIDLLIHSPKERYLRVLKRSPQLFQEIPHKHIANYLRMTPETLSRLKKY